MKFFSTFLRVLAAVLAVASLAAFFFPLVETVVAGVQVSLNGAQCAFGADLSGELSAGMHTFKGGYYLAAFILTIFTALSMILGLVSKKKGWNATGLVVGILTSIFVVVFAFNAPSTYVDMGSVAGSPLQYTVVSWLLAGGMVAATLACLFGILAKDAYESKQNGRLTIPKRVVKFLREYKSELKKVVWPGPRSVVKNTLVVLAFCGAALLLIWLVDWGLGALFELCFKA